MQGLTEFLPISSTAHLIIVPWLFGWTSPGITSTQFDVALHMGTLLAVLIYFAPDWKRLIGAFFGSVKDRRIGDDADRRLVWLIIIGCIPAAIVGGLGESKIDEMFHQQQNLRWGLLVIAIMMVVMAAVLMLAERVGRHVVHLRQVQLPQAVGIGLAQALALIPGVSRSGSTITAGLFAGLTREAAARFSFLLATPVILGAGLKSLYDVLKDMNTHPMSSADQLGYLIGFVAAAVSGYLCIAFLIRYLQRNSTAPFIWYRFMLGLFLFALLLLGFRG